MLALLYKEIWTIQTPVWMVWTGAEVEYRSRQSCFAVRNLDKTSISLDGVDTTTGLGNPGCVLASKRSCHLKLKLALLSFVILMRICFCFHTNWKIEYVNALSGLHT